MKYIIIFLIFVCSAVQAQEIKFKKIDLSIPYSIEKIEKEEIKESKKTSSLINKLEIKIRQKDILKDDENSLEVKYKLIEW